MSEKLSCSVVLDSSSRFKYIIGSDITFILCSILIDLLSIFYLFATVVSFFLIVFKISICSLSYFWSDDCCYKLSFTSKLSSRSSVRCSLHTLITLFLRWSQVGFCFLSFLFLELVLSVFVFYQWNFLIWSLSIEIYSSSE